MSSNIQVQRICQHCNKEFTAKTTVTKYCSDYCAKRAYKAKQKDSKVEKSNTETNLIKNRLGGILPIEELKAKEFLTVKDTAKLLNFSLRTTYRLIDNGTIKAINLAERKTLVRRSDIDKLFENPQLTSTPEPLHYNIADCYNLTQVQNKYKVSESAIQQLIKRHKISKVKEGKHVYVPKTAIDKLLT